MGNTTKLGPDQEELMMKPLLTVATYAFSFAALLGSASAFAFETTDAAWVDSAKYMPGFFVFKDSRLDSDSRNIRNIVMNQSTYGFAYLTEDFPSTKSYRYVFDTFLELNNPYVASDLLVREWQSYSVRNTGISFGYGRKENTKGGYTHYNTESRYDTAPDGTLLYLAHEWFDYHQGQGHYESEGYRYEHPDNYNYSYSSYHSDDFTWNLDREFESVEPFDLEEVKSKMHLDLPVSGVSIFDFENSFVYYEGEVEGVSLAQIFANAEGNLLSYRSVPCYFCVYMFADVDGERIAYKYSGTDYASYRLSWESDRKITGMTLAYNLAAVPESETWAMLLAGLGIVGVVTRKQRG